MVSRLMLNINAPIAEEETLLHKPSYAPELTSIVSLESQSDSSFVYSYEY